MVSNRVFVRAGHARVRPRSGCRGRRARRRSHEPLDDPAVGPRRCRVFEAATIVALATFGVDRTVALSYGIVVHALSALAFIPAGYIPLHYHAAAARDRTKVADEQAASREQLPAVRDAN
jgi:hypothetical protein